MEYKANYTKEEVDELVAWFKTNKCSGSIDLGEGQHIENLEKAVKKLCNTASTKYKSSIFSGSIYLLFRIREALVKQGTPPPC